MNIYFVKHGKTVIADQERLSSVDHELSEEGVTEAHRAAEALRFALHGIELVGIVASPRKRTEQTAKIIANDFGFPQQNIEYDERLTERNCDSFDGQRIAEVFSKSEEELVVGGMESLPDLYARTQACYDDLKKRESRGALLIVGHSGNLAPLVYAAQGAEYGSDIRVPELALDDVLKLQ